MEIPAAVAAETSKFAVVPVVRRLGYLVHFIRNTSDLSDQIEKLRATRTDVQTLVTASQNRDEIVREIVNTWLTKVDRVYAEATVLSDKARLVNKWFKGWCFSRFSLGKKVKMTNILIIQGLLDERTSFGDTVSDPKPTQSLEMVTNRDFETFASRESTTKLISEALQDDSISSVGVFGMPGIGKTWLVTSLASQLKKDKVFDEVVIVTISQNPVLKTIQNHIAEELSMSLGEEESTRAKQLASRLNQGKKTLIVLDDVWDTLKFEEIGIIPCKGCKVVFTTRIQDVCGKLQSDVEIKVEILSEGDAWSLFQKRGGGTFKEDSKLAKEIADECEGLPLALSALAAALRGKSDYVLEDVVRQLKKSNFQSRLAREFALIRLSYDYLPSEESRACFLICCLFPEDYLIRIEEIFYYTMGEKLFRDVDSLEEARSRVHGVMDEIVSACLLFKVGLWTDRGIEECVMMHDLIRDVAISIASEEDNGFIVKAGLELTEWPPALLDLSKCKRLSLMKNDIRSFSLPFDQIKASHLTTLCLNQNIDLGDLPYNFFMEMSNLLTLDLSENWGITSLPPSLAYLKSLRTLLMNGCSGLKDISSIETLDKLEILNLRHCYSLCSIKCLTRLINLRFIDITGSIQLRRFPHKAISNMRQLEEFHALGRKAKVDATFLAAAAGLRRLTCMEIDIITTECLFLDVPGHFQNLTKFKIAVGNEWDNNSEEWRYKRIMSLRIPCDLKRENKSLANWVVVTLGRTNLLYLSECDYIQSVVDLHQLGFPDHNMKHLVIYYCSQMKYLMFSDGVELAHFTFSHVEKLRLVDLDSFERVCKGTVPQGFLISLRVLYVENCRAMISLIHCSLLGTLHNLEEIEICSCGNLAHLIEFEGSTSTCSLSIDTMSVHFLPNLTKLLIEVCPSLTDLLPLRVLRGLLHLKVLQIKQCCHLVTVTADDTDDPENDKSILPRLKILKFSDLPTLSSLFGDTRLLVDLPSLEVLSVWDCPNLTRLPLTPHSIPKLSRFKAKTMWFNKLEWQNESIKSHLQHFSSTFK